MQVRDGVWQRLAVSRDRLADFCRHWQVVELALFGSVLRDDFRDDSDIDVLVSFAAEARITFADLDRMEIVLAQLFGRPVDVVTRRSIERSQNWIRRRNILDSAEVAYARKS